MRVTLVTETYYPQVNGVSRTLGQLVGYLTACGDAVQVVHPRYGKEQPAAPHVGVRAWRVPFYKELHLPLPPFGRVHKAIEEFQPDLVHVATEATLGLSALAWTLRHHVPVVSSFHTNFDQYSDHYRVGWARGTIWRYLRWFHNRTCETYVPSRTTINDLEARGFQRLVLWPRGVDSTLFRPDRPGRQRVRDALGFGPDDVVIGHVSRLAVEKNVAYLADALKLVAAERPSTRFLFVGGGPARGELEAAMGPGARFVGYRSGEDLADYYSAADLFAFSSLTETFGNVVLEAMASGLPVVALRAGGVGDVLEPGENGFLLPPDAPCDQFAQMLIALLDDPGLRHGLARSARAFAVGQSWDEVMSAIRRHYERVISASSSSWRDASAAVAS